MTISLMVLYKKQNYCREKEGYASSTFCEKALSFLGNYRVLLWSNFVFFFTKIKLLKG